jgi:hypothetical protein
VSTFDYVAAGVAALRIARPPEAAGLLLHRHPGDHLPAHAQLIVLPEEYAVFASTGGVLGVVGAGQHSISTQALPFLEPAVDLASGGATIVCDLYFVATTPVAGPIEGPLGSIKDVAGAEVPLAFSAKVGVRAADPSKLVTALGASRGDPLHRVRHLAVRGLRAIVDKLNQRGEITPSTIGRATTAVAAEARKSGLGLEEAGIKLVSLDELVLRRADPNQPNSGGQTAPAGQAGFGPPQPGPAGAPMGVAPPLAAPSHPGFGPPADPGQPAMAELRFSIPGVPHLDAQHGLEVRVNVHGAFLGDAVPPPLVQHVIDAMGEALFDLARTYSGSVLDLDHQREPLGAALTQRTAARIQQLGLRGHVAIAQIEYPQNDPAVAELIRRSQPR